MAGRSSAPFFLTSATSSLRRFSGSFGGKGGGGACHLPTGSAAHKVASQGGLAAAPLRTTPREGSSYPSGAFEAPSPLAEIPPRFGHAPGGGNGPSLRHVLARCWGHLKGVAMWLDDSWVGDLIAALCLFGIGYLFLLFAWVFN